MGDRGSKKYFDPSQRCVKVSALGKAAGDGGLIYRASARNDRDVPPE